MVISLSLGAAARRESARAGTSAAAAGPYPDPDFLQLDTWIVIHPDNTATFYVGKTDGGQGTGTAFRQMMCDELDIAYDKTRLIMGCTDITPDQGGSGGSDGVETRWPHRCAGSLPKRGACCWNWAASTWRRPSKCSRSPTPPSSLKSDPAKTVTYAELIGGKRFNIALTGRNVDADDRQGCREAGQRPARRRPGRTSDTTFPPRWTDR